MWSKTSIGNDSFKVTVQCAIHEWAHHVRSGSDRLRSDSNSYPVRYADDCFGARCNPQCPEQVLLGLLNELWPSYINYVVVVLIIAVTVLCLCYKTVIMWKKYTLLRRYREFINWNEMHTSTENNSVSCDCYQRCKT